MIPIEWKAVDGDDVERVEGAEFFQALNEGGIDGGDAAEHAREIGVSATDGFAGLADHLREFFPAGIDFEIPVGFVVGFVPEHYGVDHRIAEFGLWIADFIGNSDALGWWTGLRLTQSSQRNTESTEVIRMFDTAD